MLTLLHTHPLSLAPPCVSVAHKEKCVSLCVCVCVCRSVCTYVPRGLVSEQQNKSSGKGQTGVDTQFSLGHRWRTGQNLNLRRGWGGGLGGESFVGF